jgi:dihydropteroate synthase
MRSRIVGILNVTPDSFSDGGKFFDAARAIARAEEMAAEGADVIDIGGESSRPGSEPVPEEEELRRVIPVIEALAKKVATPLSIDTYKPAVAKAALEAGAKIVNDITGLKNPEMRVVAANAQVPVILMHMQGEPKTMQKDPQYEDVVLDLKRFFEERIALAKEAGITDIILDPGIGFGKTLAHNLTLLARLEEFADLGYPLLIGPSRKAFIGALNGTIPAEERLPGTLAAVVAARLHGATYFRVHDVAACRQALNVADAIVSP